MSLYSGQATQSNSSISLKEFKQAGVKLLLKKQYHCVNTEEPLLHPEHAEVSCGGRLLSVRLFHGRSSHTDLQAAV